LETRKKSIANTLIYFAAMILNIFLGWILARLNTHYLEVAVYGQFAFFLTIVIFGRSIFDFGVFEASSRLMAVEKNSEERSNLLGSSLLWAILFALLAVFTLFFLGEIVDNIFEVKVGLLCKKYAYVVGLYVLVAHLYKILRGSGHIITLALISVIPRVAYVLLLILIISFAEFTLQTTLQMMFYGIIITLIGVWIYLKPSFGAVAKQSKRIKEEVKSYGRHLYVSTVWAEILIHADKFIISYFLDSQALAFYALAVTLAIPLSHFSTSLATSLFNRFASVNIISPKIIRANLLFVSITVIIFIVLREPLINYLFSQQYGQTAELLLPLALAFGFSGLSKPYIMFLMASKHGKTVRNISILIPLIQIGCSILVIPIYGISGVAWITLFVYALDLILFVIAYQRLVKIPFSKLF